MIYYHKEVYFNLISTILTEANRTKINMPDTDNTETESSTRSRTPGNNAQPSSPSGAETQDGNGGGGWDAVIEHIKGHRIDFILAVTRALTVLCTLSYLIGFPGPATNRFKQALLMNAATSSLRLHQRMPPPPLNQLSRDYFLGLIREDSFHYFIFPFMFFTGQPITLALLPCALYALFNLAVYAISILDKLGNQEALKLEIGNFVAKYQQSLLHTIALSEVALMPTLVISVFTRVVSILVPLFYCRFLMLRYQSTRNAHLKLLISQIKTIATTYASRYMRR